MYLKFIETFHGVGQGLFYSGIVICNSNRLSFVYDCGSAINNKRFLEHEIKRFKYFLNKNSKNSILDLLVISHFHADHVSGLEMLLENLNVDTVVIPYYPPIVRFYYALANPNQDGWYYEFLRDPVTYLYNKGIKRVILIFGNGPEGEESGIPLPPSLEPPKDEEKKEIIDKLPYSKPPNLDEEDEVKYNSLNTEGRLFYKDTNGYIFYEICNIFWIFAFYNYEIPITGVNSFFKQNQIKEIIVNQELRKEIEKIYKQKICISLARNLNNTSLILYHGPYKNGLSFRFLESIDHFDSCSKCDSYGYYCFWRECEGCFRKIKHGEHLKSIATFLTGDIDLNFKFNSIVNHFRNYTNNVKTILIPHHGSKKNWSEALFKNFQNSFYFPVSFGLKNKYRHPNCEVVFSILNNMRIPIFVNEVHTYKRCVLI